MVVILFFQALRPRVAEGVVVEEGRIKLEQQAVQVVADQETTGLELLVQRDKERLVVQVMGHIRLRVAAAERGFHLG